jgi:hypothetical protein
MATNGRFLSHTACDCAFILLIQKTKYKLPQYHNMSSLFQIGAHATNVGQPTRKYLMINDAVVRTAVLTISA